MSQQHYPTFKELAEEALLNQTDISRKAEVSPQIARKLFEGTPVRRYLLARALAVINEKLGTAYEPDKNVNAPYIE